MFIPILFITSCSDSSSNNLQISSVTNFDSQVDYWCEDDENGYYFMETSLGYELYRQRKKDYEKALIRSEIFIRDLILSGNWLYYIAADHNICRIKTNGEEYSVVFNYKSLQKYDDEPVRSLRIIDGYMYVRVGFSFYQYDMSTKTVKLIDGDVETYRIIDNRLYFIGHARKDFTIYVMDLETEKTKILLGDGIYSRDKESPGLRYSNFIFINDIMYYTRRSDRVDSDYYLLELFRYENGESKLVDNTDHINEYSLFEHDSKLCYVVRKDGVDKLMQYNPKDEQITEIVTCNDYSSGSQIKGSYFYYLDSEGKDQQVQIQK